MYVFIYIYAHDVKYTVINIKSLSFVLSQSPPYDAVIGENTVVVSPKKAWCVRLGTWCQGQVTRGCVRFFLLEASRPGKKTSLLKKMNTEIFGSRGHWLTVYWKVHGCSPFTNLTHQKWYRPCPSIRDLKVPETFFGGNVQWPNIQGSFSQHDWRWIRRKKKLQNT